MEGELRSIRQLDVAADGRIAIAMQHKGGKRDRVPLAGILEGGALRAWWMPEPHRRRARQYTGSIAFDASGALVASTHPRGGLVVVWDARSGRVRASAEMNDACGVAALPEAGRFLVTGDRGRIATLDADGALGTPALHADRRWDNHVRRV